MKCPKYLVDTNVALDLVLARKPFVDEALHIFSLAEAGRIALFLSSDAISTIGYLVTKNRDAKTARRAIALLLDYVSLAPLDERVVLQGLALDFSDIEDALVASVAANAGVRAIITRDSKGFASSPVPAISPHEFLAMRALE